MANLIMEAYKSLAAPINKKVGRSDDGLSQGVVGPELAELNLTTANSEILATTTKFEKAWIESDVYTRWLKQGKENRNYWLGKQYQGPQGDKLRPLVDNVIFESVETAIPQFIKKNPDPAVELYPGMPYDSVHTEYASTIQQDLGQLGEELHVASKLKRTSRHWATTLVGVAKVGWDKDKNIPTMKVLRPQHIILDPDSCHDEDGYTGDRIGERRSLTAATILNVPGLEDGAEKVIKELVKENLATKVAFIEWWENECFFWTLDGKTVLLKKKNPHWNYDQQVPVESLDDIEPAKEGDAPSYGQDSSLPTVPQMSGESMPETVSDTQPIAPIAPDEQAPSLPTAPDGMEAPLTPEQTVAPQMETKAGFNHLSAPKMPYLFLTIFNLDDQPVDETSLISQNLSNQDIINKRVKQIDKNADNMNGGLVVSLERSGLTKDAAKGVSAAIRAGGVVGIPAGNPRDAIYRPDTPGLPADVYNQAADLRQRVRGIFGVQGSSPAGLESDNTVRGKIMNRTLDTDRIGGGISEQIELFAGGLYNWFYQLKLVYDPKYQQLVETGQVPKVRITIKQGSLLPKDKVTLANQAMQLSAQGSMSHLDMFKALEYPNAEELAANAWLEKNAPEVLYANDPRVAEVVNRMKQAAQAEAQAKNSANQPKPPSESINFKDLPPDGQVQLAAKAGIQLHPEALAAHQQLDNSTATLEKEIAPNST